MQTRLDIFQYLLAKDIKARSHEFEIEIADLSDVVIPVRLIDVYIFASGVAVVTLQIHFFG